jgi:hypothetical protein
VVPASVARNPRDLPERLPGPTVFLVNLFGAWADQSALARTGTVFAALMVLGGILAFAGAVWTSWRDWVRILMAR